MTNPMERLDDIIVTGYKKIVAKIHKEVWVILEEFDARLKKLEEGGE